VLLSFAQRTIYDRSATILKVRVCERCRVPEVHGTNCVCSRLSLCVSDVNRVCNGTSKSIVLNQLFYEQRPLFGILSPQLGSYRRV